MSMFDFRKKHTEPVATLTNSTVVSVPVKTQTQKGHASAQRVDLTPSVIEKLHKRYIAFDTETTGVNPSRDRIVEIGAVLFENGVPTKTFGTLVYPGFSIPSAASAVNHITNAMLAKAPNEDIALLDFCLFLNSCRALHGDTIICAHNASFDFNFLINTLNRIGYSASMNYIDTLSLSKKHIHGLDNYKQGTVESYFKLKNRSAHRAQSDAEMCGAIMWRLLGIISDNSGRRNTLSAQTVAVKKKDNIKPAVAAKSSTQPTNTDTTTVVAEHRTSRRIAVVQMREDGTVVAEFATIAAAARCVCVNAKSIRDTIQGKQNHAAGYRWRYKD